MSVLTLYVDEVMRTLSNDGQYPFVVNDKTVDIVRFALNTGFTDVVFDENTALRVMYQRPGESQVRAQTLTYYDTDGLRSYYDWHLLPSDLAEKGALTVALCILRTDSEVEEWHTTPCQVRVLDSIHTDDSDEADESITPTVAQRVAVLETMIQRVASGAPIVVSSVSEMTDTDQIYVLSTDGNWYYHNGSAWTAGGEYGAIATDTTLTQFGVPADAEAAGNMINAINERVVALESGGSGISDEAKQALLAIFEAIAYTTSNGQELRDALRIALYPPANISRITAVYVQSSLVTGSTPLDRLKTDLTVTAFYTDGTSETITSYFLSGTLTSGRSVITVGYGGKTATFAVNVVEALYALPQSMVFDGTNYIDTEVKLASVDRSYTIMFDETNGQNNESIPVFHCMTESSPYPGLAFQKLNNSGYAVAGYSRRNVQTAINPELNNTNKVVFRHEAGSQYLYVDYATNGVRGEQLVVDNSGTFAQSDNNLLIGCYQTTNGDKGRFWKGIVSEFAILSNVIDDNAVTEYLGV